MTFILHCGAEEVKRSDLDLIEVPESTRSYAPIPYGNAVDFLLEEIESQHRMVPDNVRYGVNAGGGQFFAQMTYLVGSEQSALSVGLRGSYSKSLSWKIGGGASMLVCDNLCFSADGFVVMRKNTTHAWRDFQALVSHNVRGLIQQYHNVEAELDTMRGTACNLKRGYAYLGVALGEKVLTPTQANVAFADWTKPRHEEFAERNMFSLYNCMTEGLKKGAAGGTIDRHTGAHQFVIDAVHRAVPKRESVVVAAPSPSPHLVQ